MFAAAYYLSDPLMRYTFKNTLIYFKDKKKGGGLYRRQKENPLLRGKLVG
jgi:hypothetical protein